ncbi:MAG: hypothetical protein ABFD92_09735 [Planctomycetaceae bacterium]|nr:hypothetical protein [Planctomycetaceae bacterium]
MIDRRTQCADMLVRFRRRGQDEAAAVLARAYRDLTCLRNRLTDLDASLEEQDAAARRSLLSGAGAGVPAGYRASVSEIRAQTGALQQQARSGESSLVRSRKKLLDAVLLVRTARALADRRRRQQRLRDAAIAAAADDEAYAARRPAGETLP